MTAFLRIRTVMSSQPTECWLPVQTLPLCTPGASREEDWRPTCKCLCFTPLPSLPFHRYIQNIHLYVHVHVHVQLHAIAWIPNCHPMQYLHVNVKMPVLTSSRTQFSNIYSLHELHEEVRVEIQNSFIKILSPFILEPRGCDESLMFHKRCPL